ncbi:MAG TPA: NAD(P)-dependent oxidoreductase [Rhizobiales bacterium]|nr:NAD(P)-dependent oxidoreductase [Hyphomicrobiales bacterium]
MGEAFTRTIGVAGCGAMGLPMAKALVAGGFSVLGYDIRPTSDFGDFASLMVKNPEQFSNQCDVIFCVVRDEAQVLDLCFTRQAIFKNNLRPQTFVLSSTVSPGFVEQLQHQLPGNITLIDAPMSGAPLAASAATLTFMVGGPEQAVKTLSPVFAAMGSKTHYLGDLGKGMTAKVLNNFVAASTVVAVRNVLYHAKSLGLDKQTLLDVMQQSSGQTWFGSNFDDINWAGETYARDNTIGILEKDVRSFIAALERGPEPVHNAIITALQTLPDLPA